MKIKEKVNSSIVRHITLMRYLCSRGWVKKSREMKVKMSFRLSPNMDWTLHFGNVWVGCTAWRRR